MASKEGARQQQVTDEAEAEDMAKRAVALIQRDGPAKAYKAFNEPEGKCSKDKDLFVFVYDFQGNAPASSGISKVVGKNLIDMKDADGLPIVRGVLEMKRRFKHCRNAAAAPMRQDAGAVCTCITAVSARHHACSPVER